MSTAMIIYFANRSTRTSTSQTSSPSSLTAKGTFNSATIVALSTPTKRKPSNKVKTCPRCAKLHQSRQWIRLESFQSYSTDHEAYSGIIVLLAEVLLGAGIRVLLDQLVIPLQYMSQNVLLANSIRNLCLAYIPQLMTITSFLNTQGVKTTKSETIQLRNNNAAEQLIAEVLQRTPHLSFLHHTLVQFSTFMLHKFYARVYRSPHASSRD